MRRKRIGKTMLILTRLVLITVPAFAKDVKQPLEPLSYDG